MENYVTVNKSFAALCSGSKNNISLLANASAFLYEILNTRTNWCGFYLLEDGELHLAPFQGKVACTPLNLTIGVCALAAREEKTIIVKNVHDFEGHIACDSNSLSEIVIPIFNKGKLYGLLDIDSPQVDTFNENDKTGLVNFVKILEKNLI